MKSRREVVEFIESQDNPYVMYVARKSDQVTCWHFGLVEMRMILDFIYDGAPKSEDEELTRLHKPY